MGNIDTAAILILILILSNSKHIGDTSSQELYLSFQFNILVNTTHAEIKTLLRFYSEKKPASFCKKKFKCVRCYALTLFQQGYAVFHVILTLCSMI